LPRRPDSIPNTLGTLKLPAVATPIHSIEFPLEPGVLAMARFPQNANRHRRHNQL